MKVIVPAKTNSERVPNKNFRKFDGEQNLVDITLSNLTNWSTELYPEDVYLSTETEEHREKYERRGYNYHARSRATTLNWTPIGEVFQVLAHEILDDEDDEVAFAMVTDPLFDRYQEVLDTWDLVKDHGYDSMGIAVPQRDHLLDSEFQPLGFGFGKQHRASQDLPVRYRFNFCFSIVKRDVFQSDPYHVGKKPFWFIHDQPSVDIDTMDDFGVASLLYGGIHG